MPGVGGWKDGKAPALGHLSLQGFQVAYVVFQKPSGVLAALALKGPLLVSTESHPVKSGIHSQYCGRVGAPFLALVWWGRFSGGSVCHVHLL